jgi:TfoX/Sxy family transcriptional regulator of competence genes
MPFDEHLAERISQVLKERSIHFEAKKMMGGLAFMVDDKMCLGVVKDELMARVGPEAEEEALRLKGSRPMDFTGRPMKGYLFVSAEGVDMEADLEHWVQLCLDFNPLAKSSKKKK